MEEIKNMSHTALINLLAGKTALYTRMLASNSKTDAFYKCKRMIEQVTAEIEARKQANNTPGYSAMIASASYRHD